jgi:hypothetical protein
MLDGGPGAEPDPSLDACLVTDADSEPRAPIRRLAAARGLDPAVAPFDRPDLSIKPLAVVRTSHPTFGYLIAGGSQRVVWAPEFLAFPGWAAGADLMFADGAAWARPIRFARGVGAHAPLLEVSRQAHDAGVRRLVSPMSAGRRSVPWTLVWGRPSERSASKARPTSSAEGVDPMPS